MSTPYTGNEFLESLRGPREVWIYGERVKDVTAHPAFRNAARSVARLYDALHDPASRDALTAPTDTGSGGYTHKFFRAARSREELVGQRDVVADMLGMPGELERVQLHPWPAGGDGLDEGARRQAMRAAQRPEKIQMDLGTAVRSRLDPGRIGLGARRQQA